MCGRRPKDELSRIGNGRDACVNRPDSSACRSARAEYGATRASAGHRHCVEWLRLGLALGTRSLEPVERWMGSTPLRADAPFLWLVGSL